MLRTGVFQYGLGAMVTAIAIAMVGCYGDKAPDELASVAGRSDLVVKSSDGKPIDLSHAGHDIEVIHFWATWCAPCVDELPDLARFQASAPKGLAFHTVAVDQGGWNDVHPFLERLGLSSFPVELDPGGAVATRFGTTKFPETWVVDRNGRVLQRFIGAQSWSRPEVRSWFESLVTPAGPSSSR